MFWLLMLSFIGFCGWYFQEQILKVVGQFNGAKKKRVSDATPHDSTSSVPAKVNKKKPKRKDITAELKMKQKQSEKQHQTALVPDHALFRQNIKGHKFVITAVAYSPNGRLLATSSTDRTIRIYQRDTLGAEGKNEKFQQINLEYDHATAMTFSGDGRMLVVATQGGTVKIYQKCRIKPELVADFPVDHKTDVHSILMNDIGNWATIVTCSEETDTELKFWNIHGDCLQVININQVRNYHCVGSIDNRYIAVAAYTPEVKIFEISREKTGAFKKANKVMTLYGHRTGVLDLAFDGSASSPVNRIVTVSKDGSIRLWDINVRYTVQEDPKVILTFDDSETCPEPTSDNQEVASFSSVAFSPDGKVLVVARDRQLVFFATSDGRKLETIPRALDDTPIHRACFDPSGKEVLVYGRHCKQAKIYNCPQV